MFDMFDFIPSQVDGLSSCVLAALFTALSAICERRAHGTDILLLWKHVPNIVIYDFVRGLATHCNLRDAERSIFSPFEGRLSAPIKENIQLAKEGKLKVSLPWLNIKKEVPDSNGHPLTGSAEHYALYDKFHEDNTKDDSDALCKLGLVPQAVCCLHKWEKNKYFLTQQLPSTHLFRMRNIIDHYKNLKNQKRINNIKKTFGTEVAMNCHHQAILGNLFKAELLKLCLYSVFDILIYALFNWSRSL